MAALRVHQLAKELGVPSKAIVEKCKAEGVPGIVAHQSTVKLGLAETIRQWFADGAAEDHAAVETAEKVDVTKVKKKATRKKAAAKKKAAPQASEPAPVAEPLAVVAEEAKPEAAAEELPTDPAALHAKAKARPQTEPLPEVHKPKPLKPDEDEKPAVAAKAVSPDTPEPTETPAEPEGPQGVQNVPDRPDVVKPAGQQLTELKKAKTFGPKVVRIEKPEPVAPPRPRGGQGGGRAPAPGEVDGISRSRGPARGGGVRGGSGGPGEDGPGDMRG
ncbi:MAG: translation initiation factor IF-2 N-terminal domain-containing protein, partial [Planctomycetota bacterium]